MDEKGKIAPSRLAYAIKTKADHTNNNLDISFFFFYNAYLNLCKSKKIINKLKYIYFMFIYLNE